MKKLFIASVYIDRLSHGSSLPRSQYHWAGGNFFITRGSVGLMEAVITDVSLLNNLVMSGSYIRPFTVDFINAAMPLIETQMLYAGYRLAYVLNTLFR